ncbi:hypothetical protein [Mesobacillus jeotgali]|jgi:hypothetical protein|uniref:DoxX-like family protein n=1 Tax=Mesobacillus jeotgali TaxID=129985 RepID=A0ABY9VFS4_9BACI|nr:hypothetical protein [Mesobacillus jeotgali]WNF22781.1 hypothetical protein RH061_21945 [Mesobacillus jeotgali]
MDAVQIVFLVLLWGVPIFRFIQEYRKMNEEEHAEIKASLKNPLYYLDDGFRYIGFLLMFTGMIASIPVIQHIGAAILFIGWFYGGLDHLDKSVKQSVGLMLFAVLMAGVYYLIWA